MSVQLHRVIVHFFSGYLGEKDNLIFHFNRAGVCLDKQNKLWFKTPTRPEQQTLHVFSGFSLMFAMDKKPENKSAFVCELFYELKITFSCNYRLFLKPNSV